MNGDSTQELVTGPIADDSLFDLTIVETRSLLTAGLRDAEHYPAKVRPPHPQGGTRRYQR